jgi:hypothetical protein
MELVDRIVAEAKYYNYTHPDFGTVMRIMEPDMPFLPVMLSPVEHDADGGGSEL